MPYKLVDDFMKFQHTFSTNSVSTNNINNFVEEYAYVSYST